MKFLVSILIPAFNAEGWIAETINSAKAQKWPHTEIVIVDDGSKDRTYEVARQFECRNVRVVTQANQGAAAARNHAFSLAQGDYIQWLDADDLLSPDKVASQMKLVETGISDDTLLSSGWATFRHRTSSIRFQPTALWASLTPLEWLLRKWENNLHMQTATWLVSRKLTAKIGPWDSRLLGDDDGEYFFRVIRNSDGIRFVSNGKVYYRVSGGARLSLVGKSNKKKDAQRLGMELQINSLLMLSDTPRVRAACVNYLQTWLHYFYPERPDLVEWARTTAASLGGQLELPQLPWKYAWIQKVFGWNAAKNAQITYNHWKAAALNKWDQTLFTVQGRAQLGSDDGNSKPGKPPGLTA